MYRETTGFFVDSEQEIRRTDTLDGLLARHAI